MYSSHYKLFSKHGCYNYITKNSIKQIVKNNNLNNFLGIKKPITKSDNNNNNSNSLI